jgi:hypothetical protein
MTSKCIHTGKDAGHVRVDRAGIAADADQPTRRMLERLARMTEEDDAAEIDRTAAAKLAEQENAGLTAADYQAALDSQSACNASGLIHSLHGIVSRIWVEVRKDTEHGGTANVNKHPIMVLFITQLAHLAGLTVITGAGAGTEHVYGKALAECERGAKTGLDTTQAKD